MTVFSWMTGSSPAMTTEPTAEKQTTATAIRAHNCLQKNRNRVRLASCSSPPFHMASTADSGSVGSNARGKRLEKILSAKIRVTH
jgi:hypothetical protein